MQKSGANASISHKILIKCGRNSWAAPNDKCFSIILLGQLDLKLRLVPIFVVGVDDALEASVSGSYRLKSWKKMLLVNQNFVIFLHQGTALFYLIYRVHHLEYYGAQICEINFQSYK